MPLASEYHYESQPRTVTQTAQVQRAITEGYTSTQMGAHSRIRSTTVVEHDDGHRNRNLENNF
jgi:hypothetical protein